MSENELIAQTEKTFEDIKHVDENGNEYWYARELMLALGYKAWRYFEGVVDKAKTACENSNINTLDHFVVDNKMVQIGSGAERSQNDYKLTRYACYIIAQNANPRLKNVALAQTYFAVKTRQQEITEEQFEQLTEDEKRLYQRNLTRKGLRYREDVLDNMGSEELAANLFRITQTESRLKRDKICTEKKACDTHNKIGKIVRKAIKEAGRNDARRFANTRKKYKRDRERK